MADKDLIIELDPWEHTCSDGCCYTYGVTVRVNGVELEGDASENHSALKVVLEHLGYNVTVN